MASRAVRIFRLAAAINLRARLKFLLLTTLITIGVLVFLGVSALSRASSSDLTDAIETDFGVAGTYQIEPSRDLQMSAEELVGVIRPVAVDYADRPLQMVRVMPSVTPECPSYDDLGKPRVGVLLDADGRPLPFRSGSLPTGAEDLCLGGMVIPREALREATRAERAALRVEMVLDPAYERLVRLTSAQPVSYTLALTTGRSDDQLAGVLAAMRSAFAEPAAEASVPTGSSVVVTRGDSGAEVRAASQGVSLVYALIGWGVLLVSGLGVLVAELIVLRDRTWYFGLARAVGARKSDVAWLVLADIVLVLLAGFGAALVIAVATAPMVESFATSTLQFQLDPVESGALLRLLLGAVLMLVLAGVYPAWRATKLDPLDVLERR